MNYKKKLLKFINHQFQFIKGGEQFDIAIIDDVFPYYKGTWRNYEYLTLSNHFKTIVYCDKVEKNYFIPEKDKSFKKLSEDFNLTYPNSKIFYKELKLFSKVNAKIFYFLFLSYFIKYAHHIDKLNIPFILNLYPEGKFDILCNQQIELLRHIANHKLFLHFTLNQKSIYNYLLNNKITTPDKILFFEGIFLHFHEFINKFNNENKKYFQLNKSTLDIVFVAHKYSLLGVEKGFDIFLEVSKILIQKYDFCRFHIVGSFNENDIPYKELLKYYKFYGFQEWNFFVKFYEDKDLIILPNRAFVHGGSFDGYPYGPSIEAALSQTLILSTDYLNENDFLIDKVDYFNINNGILKIIEIIEFLINNPLKIKEIAINGCKKYINKYNTTKHIEQKVSLFKYYLNK